MEKSSRIAALAERIRADTLEVDQYIQLHNLQTPSFEENGPQKFVLSPAIESKRLAVIDASLELRELLMTPRELLFSNEPNNLVGLHAIHHFGIAHKVPVGGQSTFKDIALQCDVDESFIKRILRHSTTRRIFQEKQNGIISHSAISRLIAEDAGAEAWLGICVEDMWHTATQTIPAFIKWPGSEEPNESGYSLGHRTSKAMYEALQEDPIRAQRFGAAMSALSSCEGYEPHHVVENINWGDLGTAKVVDVGGSHGDMMLAVANQCGHLPLTLVVQDNSATIGSIPVERKSSFPKNISFMEHDFFQVQPLQAKVYLFRWIFHNWSDKYCVKILDSLKPALEDGSRIIIIDMCLPAPHEVPVALERKLRQQDLAMLQIQNSRERDSEDWNKLCQTADSRFRLLRIRQPPDSQLALIEISWNSTGKSILRD